MLAQRSDIRIQTHPIASPCLWVWSVFNHLHFARYPEFSAIPTSSSNNPLQVVTLVNVENWLESFQEIMYEGEIFIHWLGPLQVYLT